jgi:hypothetical protein
MPIITKQITDLDASTGFSPGDLLLTRKTGETVDKKIDQATFIKSIGNPAVAGFIATSSVANQLLLTPSNNVIIDTYYSGMIVSFISPIDSTGNVNIKIGTLPLKTLQQIGSDPLTTTILKTGEYYEAVYIGNATTGSFFQTNVIKPTIFTNEYIASGTIAPDLQSTTYALATAYGATKTAYYAGMSALFTVDIKSQGAVLINIDGLGNKTLLDPPGDNIPFVLLPYEPILAIYDGTVFRKHMFSKVEPIDPVDPPTDITVTVGPDGEYTTIEAAITALQTQYGDDGENVTATIQLQLNFIGGNYIHSKKTPWITIKSYTNGNDFTSIKVNYPGEINFTGKFIKSADDVISGFIQTSISESQIMGKAKFINTTLQRTATTNNNTATCVYYNSSSGNSLDGGIEFENVSITGFHKLLSTNGGDTNSLNGQFIYKNSTLLNFIPNNNGNGSNTGIISSYVRIQLSNINFNTITRAVTFPLILINRYIMADNITMTCASNAVILDINALNNEQSTLINCNLKNSVDSNQPALRSASALVINGGDYRKTSLSTSTPDIVALANQNARIILRNTVLGATQANPPGTITQE